eukprot:81800_1
MLSLEKCQFLEVPAQSANGRQVSRGMYGLVERGEAWIGERHARDHAGWYGADDAAEDFVTVEEEFLDVPFRRVPHIDHNRTDARTPPRQFTEHQSEVGDLKAGTRQLSECQPHTRE